MHKVVLIAGSGRSGSTLLDRMLGQLPGFASTGELGLTWKDAFQTNRTCGCGRAFRDCPYWRRLIDRAFGALDESLLDGWIHATRRHRSLPGLLFRGRREQERWEGNARAFGKLADAIRADSGARVLVDSSKSILQGHVWASLPKVDLRILHLVRDSRAVAYAYQKRRDRPDLYRPTPGVSFEFPTALFDWIVPNLVVALKPWRAPLMRIRYEDLVTRPGNILRLILRFLDEPAVDPDFVRGGRIRLDPNHMISGNRMRWQHGDLQIRLDDEWKRKLLPRHHTIVTALTWPLLLRYGYV